MSGDTITQTISSLDFSLSNSLDIIFWIVYSFVTVRLLHVLQQESYQSDGMFRWITKNPKLAFGKNFIHAIITTIVFAISEIALILLASNNVISISIDTLFIPTIISMIAYVGVGIYQTIKEHKAQKQAKKPLQYTWHAKRVLLINFFTIVILEVIFLEQIQGYYSFNITETSQEIIYYSTVYRPLLMAFLTFTLPVNIIIANWFENIWLEDWCKQRFIKKAKKVLAQKEYKDLIKIGITGSYGKTSTKFILKTILSEKYNVLATPGSFNTTYGNIRVIREQLKPEHQIFISEMGARKRHDIDEICSFVRPDISIITSVGAQHLETFKTIDNVAKTKGEILNWTSYGGAVFLPNDGAKCLELYNNFGKQKTSMLEDYFSSKSLGEILKLKPNDVSSKISNAESNEKDSADEEQEELTYERKKFLYSTNVDDKLASVKAKNIKVSPKGSTFTVVSKNLGNYECTTCLLGTHNVQNIIGAIAIAEYLGLSKEEIIAGVSKIEPIEHRLQILPSANGTTVIDDAFNSNPVGSKCALDVIKQFDGRKIIITPGMVELGEEEQKYNKEFGRQMAEAVDIAILVGQIRSKPIVEGLKENGFDQMNLYVVESLDAATKKLGELTKAGDVILFENDLPDSYNEK